MSAARASLGNPLAVAWRPVGDCALLLEAGDPDGARHLAETLVEAGWPGVVDVVGGLRTVLVVVDPARADPAALGAALRPPPPRSAGTAAGRHLVVPVTFDGPDLHRVASMARTEAADVVAELTAARLQVAMIGFSPGFAYLAGLPEPLRAVSRRPEPRPAVPPGSLGVAGGFAGLYPQRTPGGWQIVGRTDQCLFDPLNPPYSLLRPGDRVQLRSRGRAGEAPRPGADGRDRAPWSLPAGSAAVLEVAEPGLLTTVQDAGRSGVAGLGVPAAGPADPVAHRLANRLVGNPAEAAALEATARGPVLRVRSTTYVALVGGGMAATLDGRPVEAGRVVPVSAGQRLALGEARTGLRGYLAVRGGLSVPRMLGSASTDTLTWLGPGPLVAGDLLGTGRPTGPLADHVRPGTPDAAATPGGRRVLRVLRGPHPEWFGPRAFESLVTSRFEVAPHSDRVGVRLRPVGGRPLPRAPGEIDSQGMVTGAIQVPPNGEPVVLLPDHATLGGYPVIAVVIWADLPILGQCRPGDVLELRAVDAAAAAAARRARERELDQAVAGRYPVVPA